MSSSLAVLVGMAMPLGALLGGLTIKRTQNVELMFATIGSLIFATGVVVLFTPPRDAERHLPKRRAE